MEGLLIGNEAITENIVRDHLRGDDLSPQVIIEEKSSKNNKIDKLLKNASKSGKGKGQPDFIIQFKDNRDFIIVIECKAETKNHESNDRHRQQYKNYAVDGVLLYASFLSKEYDVLAIAVSGEDIKNIRISHFLQLKNTEKAHPIFKDDKFFSLGNYLDRYKTDERKFNQDYEDLSEYFKILNEKLHNLNVKESQRSLLISGILIALKDKAFAESYKHRESNLADSLVTAIGDQLLKTQVDYEKDIISSSYSFIKTHTIFANQYGVLKELIEEIDEKINTFNKTHKYRDTIGKFYIEFLRYANDDKSLGIVLTPPHITEFFCEIANVNENSVILDTCAGTGGFLISAMRKMILAAGSNTEKEKRIKEKQIVGVEFQHDIYSLLCSNMFIHGDGRSNLIKKSCFDNSAKERVAKFDPNVGFLNPPYKVSKGELEFVLNNLEQLKEKGCCVAIVPMSCALNNKEGGGGVKKEDIDGSYIRSCF